jgi:hypothetical protein
MCEKLGKGVRHDRISRGRVKGDIILQRRDFKGNKFIGHAESFLSPLSGLISILDRYPALAPQKKRGASGGAKIVLACAGINRHGVADERAVQERSSEPS